MKKLDEINEMWAKDCVLDETNLAKETTRIPPLHNKYYRLYIHESLLAKKLKTELQELEKLKSEYYSGSMDGEELKRLNWKPNQLRIIRQDIPKYLESDKDIIALSLRIDYHSSIASYLEDIIKQINSRNFLIRNIIEWNKFTHGTS